MKKYRYITLVLLICLQFSMLTGCYDRRELDDLAYPVALGFDKGVTNELRMTLQLALPIAIGGGEGGGGGDGEKSVSVVTVDTPTVYSGLNMLNTFISKQINLSHVKAIIFSEELAKEGITRYLHAMIRNREFRPSMHVIVSRDPAEKFINAVKPSLETNPAKYYELLLSAYKYTGFTADSQMIEFYHKSKSTAVQPVAVLAGVNRFESTDDFDLNGSTYKEKGREVPLEGDFRAGELTKTGDLKVEIMGLAVFDGGKMVGELDGDETTYHLMIEGTFNSAFFTMPDPIEKDKFIVLNIKISRKTEKKVNIIGDKPELCAKVILEADILSIQSGINYESKDNLKKLENSTEEFLKKGMLRYLEKNCKQFGTDTNGFGLKMKSKFLTWKEWEEYDWLTKYKESTFDVKVDVKIRRPGLILKSVPETKSN